MSDYKKIIFLDIDGVLASVKYLCTGQGFVDPEKCKLLNTLEDIGAEIVISSSWGYDGGRTEKTLRDCGLTLPIIGYTQHLHFNWEWACRGNEIDKWITDNFGGMGTMWGCDDDGLPYHRHHRDGTTDYEYVILDDGEDMLLGQKDNFIKIHDHTGITKRDINKARKILTRNASTDRSTPSQE